MDKQKIAKMFGIETYKAENDNLAASNNRLAQMLEHEKAVCKSLADDFVKMEEELHLLKQDPEQYIEIEVEKRVMEYEKQHEDEMNHKWYQIGRQDAYKEMGIRALEAKKNGSALYMTDDGEVIEDISNGLEDVVIDGEEINSLIIKHVDELDSITIDDLSEM